MAGLAQSVEHRTSRFLVRYWPSPTQRMSSTAWITAVKWEADARCDAPPLMQNNLPGLALVERG